MNYDPNIVWAKQTVRLTFGLWTARATMDIEIVGNCKGATIFDSAIEMAFERLSVQAGPATLVMMYPDDGDLLYSECDEDCGEEWLKEMCIGCEIVDIRREEP